MELKSGNRARVQTEMLEFIAVPFLLSSKLKIWSFHVVVVQGRHEMYKKARCTCRLVVLLIKRIALLTFPLPSPSRFRKVSMDATTATTRRTSKKQLVEHSQTKKQLCMCITLSCTFLCRHCMTTTGNFTFYRGRKQATGKFSFSF